MHSEAFTFGIKDLDKLLGSSLKFPSMIVVAGHPGAGKTTLAATICYANALRGRKCLYISQQESREKFFEIMKSLGMDFYELEKKGFIKHTNFPIASDIESIVNEISSIISTEDFKVVVIDSINPLLQAVEGSHAKRAWLYNYFYQIPKTLNGLLILIAELPFEKEHLELGSIEFVADAILILKHRIDESLLTRKIEIRKARGSPISIAEIPFSIVENKGIELYVPPILEEIPREGPEIDVVCSSLKSVVGHLHKGMVMYISYPPDARPILYVPILLCIAVINNLKIHVISYLYPPDTTKDLIRRGLKQLGLDESVATKIIDKHILINSINPFAYSIEELAIKELYMIPSDADIVAFHGTEVVASKHRREYIGGLYNQLNYLKKINKLVVRIGASVNDEVYNVNAMLSDVIMKFHLEEAGKKYRYNVYIWRRGEKPAILTEEDLYKCFEEIASIIKKKVYENT
ncbi:MAG: ATPase domain-containing protein [Ignisphaera sp.]